MSTALPEQQAHAFYDASVQSILEMRHHLMPACRADSTADGQDTANNVDEQLTADGKMALESFDTWAEEILYVITVGILEKDKKDAPSIEQLLEAQKKESETHKHIMYLPTTSRASLLRTFLLLVLTTCKRYDARSRVLLRQLAHFMELPFPSNYEESADEALKHPEQAIEQTKEAAAKREESGRQWRNWKVGLGALAGGVAIGLSGGLAAPLVGAGFASLLGAVGLGSTAAGMMLGGLASSSLIVGSLFGAYGGHMSGKMVARRTKEVSDFDFKPLLVNSRLHATICVTGWLNEIEEVIAPWTIINGVGDVLALQWEVQALLELGRAMMAMIKAKAIGYIKGEILKRTVLASLMSALWPLQLLQVGQLIDNPWSTANDLAKKTGGVLADVLIEKAQGERPVTLIGYSLGARVIFYCLEELSRRRAFGLVEHAYMFGLPGATTAARWKAIRLVVNGFLVNGYSKNDWLLGFLFRSSNIAFSVAGLQPVKVTGVINVDVSALVEGHFRYRGAIGKCLKMAGFEDLNEQQVEEQNKVLQEIVRQESTEDLPIEHLVQAELAQVRGSDDSTAPMETDKIEESAARDEATFPAPPLPPRNDTAEAPEQHDLTSRLDKVINKHKEGSYTEQAST